MQSLPTSWLATVICSELGDEELSAEIRLSPADLVADTGNGQFAIPLRRLQVARGQDGRLLFSDPEHQEWLIAVPDPTVLRHPAFQRQIHLVRQVRQIQAGAAARQTLKLCAAFLVVFTAIVAAWLVTAPWLVRLAVSRLPESIDTKLAAAAAEGITNRIPVLNDAALNARLAVVTDRLLRAGGNDGNDRYRYRFTVLDLDDVHAVALPGGQVFVCRGLIEAVESGEELAGVIAHELAHIRHRHALQQLVIAGGPLLLIRLALGENQALLGALAGTSQELLGLSFSREHEREADESSFKYLVAANIDPRGLLNVMRRLEALERAHAGLQRDPGERAENAARSGRLERVLSTHPLTPERLAHLKSLWERSPRKTGFQPMAWPASKPQVGGIMGTDQEPAPLRRDMRVK